MDEIEIQAPTENERVEMLNALSLGFHIGPGVSFTSLASKTAGMVLADFRKLFSEAVVQAQEDVMSYCMELGLLRELPKQDSDSPLGDEDYIECHRNSVNLQKDICSAG